MSEDELPDWARITSDLASDTDEDDTFDGVPLPAVSAGTVTPSRPGRPKPPSQPSPVPTPPSPTPSAPVPQETSPPVPVPQETGPSVPPRPAPPVSTPPQPTSPSQHNSPHPPAAYTAVADTYDDAAQPIPAAPIPVKGSGKASRRRKSWRNNPSPPVDSAATPAGGKNARMRVIVLRIAVWGVLAIVALAGMRAIIAPPRVSIPAVADAVAEQYKLTTFPAAEGEAVALAFARTYLTYSPETKQARTDKLAQLVVPSLRKASWLQEVSDSSQNVATGPYLLAEPSVALTQYATYVVAAAVIDPKAAETARKQNQILNPSWVYLSIPIYWASNGGVAVSGAPAFMPGPPEASEGGEFDITYDTDASQSARIDLTDFFEAWGASDSVALARYTTDASDAAATTGLGGTVTLVKVQKIQVQQSADPLATRFAQAAVTWNYGGTELTQAYRLDVAQDAEGRWYVLDITGGDFQP